MEVEGEVVGEVVVAVVAAAAVEAQPTLFLLHSLELEEVGGLDAHVAVHAQRAHRQI